VALLKITRHVGYQVAPIHTIKSGFIIPLLVIALGLPFVPLGSRPRRPAE
jgi:hypothetical protein